jgi:hypothetical protein
MPDAPTLGRLLIAVGGALVLVGLVLLVAGRIPFLGRLPGDFTLRRGPVTVSVPIVTSLLLSLLLTIALNLWLRR